MMTHSDEDFVNINAWISRVGSFPMQHYQTAPCCAGQNRIVNLRISPNGSVVTIPHLWWEIAILRLPR